MNVMKNIFKMSNYSRVRPIVVVLGATGVGKSKLAIEIASNFNGEIISADSMQIYKGLDIITNKVTTEECNGIHHHMIGFLNPLDIYNVVDFRDAALKIINDLHNKGKLPVIVGGTHYYVESLLWDVLINNIQEIKRKCSDLSENGNIPKGKAILLSSEAKNEKVISYDNISEISDSQSVSNNDHFAPDNVDYRKKLEKHSNEELLQMLQEVDPEMAQSYHPNNRRKIIRSLEIWYQTGVRHSEHLRHQVDRVGVTDLGGALRFDHVSLLWITCDQEVLDKRLDSRVDVMVEQGLVEELSQFNATFNATKLDSLRNDSGEIPTEALTEHYRNGIFQCIGFKEFHEFLSLSPAEKTSEHGSNLFNEAVKIMKLRTRQYSRRQIKWIKNRFLKRDRVRLPVYGLDGSDLSSWNEKVYKVASEVVESMLNGIPSSVSPVPVSEEVRKETKTRHECDICKRIFIGDILYEAHLQSKKHSKVLKRLHREQSIPTETEEEN